MTNEIKKVEETGIVQSSFKRYFGYVLQLSKEKLDAYRETNNISADDFIELLITFVDEERTIKMSYREFKKRLQ